MKVENPVALRFILQDELYLLNTDKAFYEERETPPPIIERSEPEIKTQPIEIVPQEAKPETKTPEPAFNYLGKNLKNFLILVHYPHQEFIADAHLAALQNILKRKEFELDDVVILNMAKYSTTTIAQLAAFFKPVKLLLLGQAAIPQGMTALALNTPKTSGSRTALYSFSFDEMMDSVDNKKIFWELMKAL
ncbi:hypothetical protein SAMN05421821_102479 [Mucilaginibacter lappiensis]|uniref:Uncharacterized protein n=1 Tax=Mucilaginibacter lappiensis TaxID=354630 RepID=A0ABR6PGA3_9SPHI|nr:hypothetical protein [Mucilaginibacter lappiensis]MBB6108284.1 hypothetical protein [Mucilaginibacter lappiensis]SIQ44081.1 hypothetical protein SAMN05421821_102479 [Mucilaginibacter lappiensis]